MAKHRRPQPQILQLTLARFMEDGHYNAHVRAMRKLYAGRRCVMLEAIGKHLGQDIALFEQLRAQAGVAGQLIESLAA